MIKNSTPVSNNQHPWLRVYGLSERGERITLLPLDVVPLGQGSGERKKVLWSCFYLQLSTWS